MQPNRTALLLHLPGSCPTAPMNCRDPAANTTHTRSQAVCTGSPLKCKFSCKRRPHKSITCSVLLGSWVNKPIHPFSTTCSTERNPKGHLPKLWKDALTASRGTSGAVVLYQIFWFACCKKWPFSVQTARFYLYECSFFIYLKMVTSTPFKNRPIIFSNTNHYICNHTSDFSSKLTTLSKLVQEIQLLH